MKNNIEKTEGIAEDDEEECESPTVVKDNEENEPESEESKDATANEPEKEEQEEKSEDTADTPKESEKSSFSGEPEDEANDMSLATQTTTTAAVTEDGSDDEPVSKYMLLDRLFKFIEVEEGEPINNVLAGYFSKVVSLLINRKQK